MKKRGFTLIELMVVISIITLISSVVLVSLVVAKDRAKNTKHIQNLVQLRNALEAYANDHKSKYPIPEPSAGGANGIYFTNNNVDFPTYTNQTAPGVYYTPDWIPGLVSGGYIRELPKFVNTPGAPLGCSVPAPTYYYRSNAGYGYKVSLGCPEGGLTNTSFINNNSVKNYSVCMENKNDGGGTGDSIACAY